LPWAVPVATSSYFWSQVFLSFLRYTVTLSRPEMAMPENCLGYHYLPYWLGRLPAGYTK
jgi:hypothetical protein